MSDVVADVIVEVVRTRRFLDGSRAHVDGLAGYVRDFLDQHKGTVNQHGRPWTVELCAEALNIPPPTLRRWVGASGQQGPAPFTDPKKEANRVRGSNARTALADPEQRHEVIASLPPEVRDEVRAELIAIDLPAANRCHHCPAHCPEGSHA